MCSPRCVEPLCFLVQRNPTVGLTGILERRYSLSKRKITKCKPLHLPFFSFTRFSYFHFPSSTNYFCSFISFLLFFLFLFSSHFPIFSSSHFSSFFSLLFFFLSLRGAYGQKEEVSFPLPQAKCVAFHFNSFSFIPYSSFMISYPTWLYMSHGIHATHVAQCEPFLFMQMSHS